MDPKSGRFSVADLRLGLPIGSKLGSRVSYIYVDAPGHVWRDDTLKSQVSQWV